MVGDYVRVTVERSSLDGFRPEVAAAIRGELERRELSAVVRDAIVCVETTNTRRRKGFFAGMFGSDPDAVHTVSAVLTPGWLIWCRSGEKYGTSVVLARTSEIEVTRLALPEKMQGAGVPNPELEGVTVYGLIGGSPERASAFIGLGPEPAAQKFREALKAAIARARSQAG